MKMLDNNYTNKTTMLNAGWTATEINALVDAPRTQEAALKEVDGKMKFVWPYSNGYKLLFSCFTEAEKQMYRKWYNDQPCHQKGYVPKSGGSSRATLTEEQRALWESVIAKTKASNPELMPDLYKLCPLYDVTMPVYRLFGQYELPTKAVSAYWIMFTKAGQRNSKKSLTRKEALEWCIEDETVEQTMSMSELDELIAQVEGAADLIKK